MRIFPVRCIVMSLLTTLVLSLDAGTTRANPADAPAGKHAKQKAREGKAKKDPESRKEALKKMLARRDTDQNGTLSLAEFQGGPKQVKDPAKAQKHAEQQKKKFARMDADGNGELTLKEMLAQAKKAANPKKPGKKKQDAQ